MIQVNRDGFLVLDKPAGITSRAALDRAARWFPRRTRIGHTGTLDPLATGVLVLAVGNATRLTEYVQQMSKTYRSRFRLGARSDTDDADGTITRVEGWSETNPERPPAAEAVAARLAEMVGTIEQVPPAYSAVRVSGRRAYDLARAGEPVELLPRAVRVYSLDVHCYEYPILEVEVHCGKGTYIRSLARQLGDRLGCGAYVETLRRTRVGPFTAGQAVSLDAESPGATGLLLPVETAVADLAAVTLPPDDARRFCQGQAVAVPSDVTASMGVPLAVFDAAQRLLAVAEYDGTRRLLRPTKVLATP